MVGRKLGKTQGRYLLAVRVGKQNEIFAFKSKHDRAMALDSMARKTKGKLSYSMSTLSRPKKRGSR